MPENLEYPTMVGETFQHFLLCYKMLDRTMFLESVEQTKYTAKKCVIWMVHKVEDRDQVYSFIDNDLEPLMLKYNNEYVKHLSENPKADKPHRKQGKKQPPQPSDPYWLNQLHPNKNIKDSKSHTKYKGRAQRNRNEPVANVFDLADAEPPLANKLRKKSNKNM